MHCNFRGGLTFNNPDTDAYQTKGVEQPKMIEVGDGANDWLVQIVDLKTQRYLPIW